MATAHLIAAALVRRGGRILLVKEIGPRDSEPSWMLPGGVVEARETVIETLARELGEETGLMLVGQPVLAFAVHVVGADDAYLALTFACDADGTLAPRDPDGLILDVAWVDVADALGRLERVAWYDAAPLRRFLRADQRLAAVTVVDRR